MKSNIETKLESSLLYTKEDGSQSFIHDTIQEFYLAKYFAEKINNEEISIEEFWEKYASEIGVSKDTAKIFKVYPEKDYRVLSPKYEKFISIISQMLDINKINELEDKLEENYNENFYNASLQDIQFIWFPKIYINNKSVYSCLSVPF